MICMINIFRLINHTPCAKNIDYENRTGKARLLLGSDYALLRRSFSEKAGCGQVRDSVDRVTICFGGSDPRNYTLRFLEALRLCPNKIKVDIVVGASNQNDLTAYFGDLTDKLQTSIHRNLCEQDIVNLLLGSDLVVCSPSGVAIEVCTLNIPMVVSTTASNQIPMASYFSEHGLAQVIPSELVSDPLALFESLKKVLLVRDHREYLVANQRKIYDGKSGPRLRNEIIGLTNNMSHDPQYS